MYPPRSTWPRKWNETSKVSSLVGWTWQNVTRPPRPCLIGQHGCREKWDQTRSRRREWYGEKRGEGVGEKMGTLLIFQGHFILFYVSGSMFLVPCWFECMHHRMEKIHSQMVMKERIYWLFLSFSVPCFGSMFLVSCSLFYVPGKKVDIIGLRTLIHQWHW